MGMVSLHMELSGGEMIGAARCGLCCYVWSVLLHVISAAPAVRLHRQTCLLWLEEFHPNVIQSISVRTSGLRIKGGGSSDLFGISTLCSICKNILFYAKPFFHKTTLKQEGMVAIKHKTLGLVWPLLSAPRKYLPVRGQFGR